MKAALRYLRHSLTHGSLVQGPVSNTVRTSVIFMLPRSGWSHGTADPLRLPGAPPALLESSRKGIIIFDESQASVGGFPSHRHPWRASRCRQRGERRHAPSFVAV